MGLINMFTKRCVFCKDSHNTEYIRDFGNDNMHFPGSWYHNLCLQEVACEPEKHSARLVDIADDILKRIERKKKLELNIIKTHAKKIARLKAACV